MATTISDLLNDVIVQAAEAKDANQKLSENSTRLIDALALIGKPLAVGGEVVIGNLIVRRQYSMIPVTVSDIANICPDTVV